MSKVFQIQDWETEHPIGVIRYEDGWRWACALCLARSKPNYPHDFASGAAKALFAHIEQKHSERLKGT